jgi:DNA-binding LytR/AlgR family response regulator
MFTCIIVDDQEYATRLIEEHLNKIPQLVLLKTFTDSIEALDFLEKNSVDIAFLDVDMPNLNGFQIIDNLSRKLKTKLPSFILITGHTQYALSGYDYDIAGFLVKPVDFNRFKISIDRWMEKQVNVITDKDYFFIESDGVKLKLNYKNIAYVESQGNWIEIVENKSKRKIYKSMHYIEGILVKNKDFLRVHKSFIISVNFISTVKTNEIEMNIEGVKKTISIGGTYKENVLKKLMS